MSALSPARLRASVARFVGRDIRDRRTRISPSRVKNAIGPPGTAMGRGGAGGVPSHSRLPQGLPRRMNRYDPMEFVITQDVTYILVSHVNDSYRPISTDGKGGPKEDQYADP